MPPRMQTKVRVKRVELLKIVEGRVRKAENDYKRAKDSYPALVEAWKVQAVKRLVEAGEKATAGKVPDPNYTGDVTISVGVKPEKPSVGRDLCNLRRMHTTLKIGAEDTVLLSQDDADFYYGPCLL